MKLNMFIRLIVPLYLFVLQAERVVAADMAEVVPERVPIAQRMRKILHEDINAGMSSFFNRSRVSPDKRMKVIDILVIAGEKQREAMVDPAVSSGLLEERLKFIGQEAQGKLALVLGSELAEKTWLVRESRECRRTVVADFSARCVSENVPISDEIAEEVALVCYEFRMPIPYSNDKLVDSMTYKLYTKDDYLIVDRVKKILSSRQIDLFGRALAARYVVR